MNCYQYSIMNDEKVIQSGYLQASNKVVLEKRLSKEILPKIDNFNSMPISVKYSQVFCQKCNSDHDVVNFFYDDHELVLCQSCRFKFFKL